MTCDICGACGHSGASALMMICYMILELELANHLRNLQIVGCDDIVYERARASKSFQLMTLHVQYMHLQ